jgi:hypothetical protein
MQSGLCTKFLNFVSGVVFELFLEQNRFSQDAVDRRNKQEKIKGKVARALCGRRWWHLRRFFPFADSRQ